MIVGDAQHPALGSLIQLSVEVKWSGGRQPVDFQTAERLRPGDAGVAPIRPDWSVACRWSVGSAAAGHRLGDLLRNDGGAVA
jgi:hypothetical protein